MVRTFRAISANTLRLIVFDLDGTLIDSRTDLSNAVNAMLRHFNRQPLSESMISSYIGNGASTLVRRALGEPISDSLLQSAMDYFLDYYQEHKLDHTKVYPGVFDALRELRQDADGAKRPKRSMAVLTNKPVGASQAICDALGLSPYFFRIYGGNSFPTKKPDAQGLHALIHEAGVSAGETLMIGDSNVDILTARNAGAWSVGCTYGLAPLSLEAVRPDCLVDSPREWPLALAGEAAGALRS